MKINGQAVLVIDEAGKFINDIDTDQIYHNRYLAITDPSQMGQYAFSALKGWEDYPKRAKKGDVLICGENFGAGSSRQQAVECFKVLGVSAIIAKSFAPIYWRNAINAALAVIVAPDITEQDFAPGDKIEIDMQKGEIKNLTSNKTIKARPASSIQLEILESGGLFNLSVKE